MGLQRMKLKVREHIAIDEILDSYARAYMRLTSQQHNASKTRMLTDGYEETCLIQTKSHLFFPVQPHSQINAFV